MMKWAYGAGKVVGGEAPTAETLLSLIQAGASHMNNCHVPRAGRGMFIAETYAAMLPNLANLTYLEKLGSQALTENSLPRVAGYDVHVVPDADMPAGVYFILQHKDACPFAQKLAKYKIQKDPMGIDGNVIEGRVRYWAGRPRGEVRRRLRLRRRRTASRPRPRSAAPAPPSPSPPAGATIYVTTDGTDPRYSSTRCPRQLRRLRHPSRRARRSAPTRFTDAKYPSPSSRRPTPPDPDSGAGPRAARPRSHPERRQHMAQISQPTPQERRLSDQALARRRTRRRRARPPSRWARQRRHAQLQGHGRAARSRKARAAAASAGPHERLHRRGGHRHDHGAAHRGAGERRFPAHVPRTSRWTAWGTSPSPASPCRSRRRTRTATSATTTGPRTDWSTASPA